MPIAGNILAVAAAGARRSNQCRAPWSAAPPFRFDAFIMTLLRLFVIILVLANLVLLVLVRGWLGAPPSGAAARRAAPLHPERVHLLSTEPYVPVASTPPADAAPTTAPVDTACLRLTGLKRDAVTHLHETIQGQSSGVQMAERITAGSHSYWVHLTPAANRVQAERRAAELKALGVNDLFVTSETHPKPYTVSIGVFKDEAIAREAVKRLENIGIKDVEMDTRSGGDAVYAVDLRGPRDAVQSIVASVAKDGQPAAQACGDPAGP